MMHPIYMPFTDTQLRSHYTMSKGRGETFIAKYRKKIEDYQKYVHRNPCRKRKKYDEMKGPCRIEKDEKGWTAACLMAIFYNDNKTTQLIDLSKRAYGAAPSILKIDTWKDCFDGDICLFFELGLQSPVIYSDWLSENLTERHFIPYVLNSAYGRRKGLETAPILDAMILNSANGFAILIEAKVLSDSSVDVRYDSMRNQLTRTIDAMLEKNNTLSDPLGKRDPEKTLFLLVTPKIYKDNPTSRLYGYRFNEYKNDPSSLARDLPHRCDQDWQSIADRLGWLTWEDFRGINANCCQWLEDTGV